MSGDDLDLDRAARTEMQYSVAIAVVLLLLGFLIGLEIGDRRGRESVQCTGPLFKDYEIKLIDDNREKERQKANREYDALINVRNDR